MKKIAFILLATFTFGLASTAYAGSCDYHWQRAKDGSKCGDRAADRR